MVSINFTPHWARLVPGFGRVTYDVAVNFTKTKEMVMGSVALSSNLPLIQWAEGQIERVYISSFKLLGLHLDADFSWHSHVEAVTSKATKRLYIFKAVKESWCPSRSTVALLFGSDQACARIRSSCVA